MKEIKIASPLRYPGGKSRAIDMIIPLIPNFKNYVEPFVGGGSIFLNIKNKFGYDKSYWINDKYTDLYNFWLVLRDNSEEMIDILLKWKREYQNGKMLQQFININLYKFSDIEKAASFLVRNRTSFSGIEGGFSAQAYKQNFSENIIKRLKWVGDMLKEVKITNLDYTETLNNEIDKNDTLYILDPPYFKAENLYGKKGTMHRYFDHYKFAKVVKELNEKSDAKFIITYDDTNLAKQLFSWAKIIPWKLVYTSRNPKIGNEIFIMNFDPPIINFDQLNKGNKCLDPSQKSIDEAWE